MNKRRKILITGVFLIIVFALFLLFRINSRVLFGDYQGTLANDTTYFKFVDDKMYLSTDGDSVMLFDKVSDKKSYDEEVDVRMHMISYRLNKTETKNLKNGGDTTKYTANYNDNLFATVVIFNNDYTEFGLALNIHSPSLKDALLDPLVDGRLSKMKNPEFPEISKKDDATIKREEERAAEEASIAKAESEKKIKDKAAEKEAEEDAIKLERELLYQNLVNKELIVPYSDESEILREAEEIREGDYLPYSSNGTNKIPELSDDILGEKIYVNGFIEQIIQYPKEKVWLIKLNLLNERYIFSVVPFGTNFTKEQLVTYRWIKIYGIYKGTQTLEMGKIQTDPKNKIGSTLPFIEGKLIMPGNPREMDKVRYK